MPRLLYWLVPAQGKVYHAVPSLLMNGAEPNTRGRSIGKSACIRRIAKDSRLKILLVNCSPARRSEASRPSAHIERYFAALAKRGVKMGDQRHEANNGLLSIAGSLLAHGHETVYLDLNYDEIHHFQRHGAFFTEADIISLLDEAMDGVGMVLLSALTISFPIMKLCGRHIRQAYPGVPIMMGGIFATLNPDKFSDLDDCFDVVVLGEGEEIVPKVVDMLAAKDDASLSSLEGIIWRDQARGEHIMNPGQNFVSDLDALPFPAYELMRGTNNVFRIFSARGCPCVCTFCSPAHMSGHQLRLINPERVIEQIEYVHTRFHVQDFVFGDLTFLGDGAHSKTVLRLLIEKKLGMRFWCQSRFDCLDEEAVELLRQAGCAQLALGIESFNQDILEAVRKGIRVSDILDKLALLKDSGIEVQGYFVIGLPGEKRETILNTIEFLRYSLEEGLIHRPHIGVYVPFPGLPIPREVTVVNTSYDAYTSGVFFDLPPRPAARTKYLSEEEVFTLWEHALTVAGEKLLQAPSPAMDAYIM